MKLIDKIRMLKDFHNFLRAPRRTAEIMDFIGRKYGISSRHTMYSLFEALEVMEECRVRRTGLGYRAEKLFGRKEANDGMGDE